MGEAASWQHQEAPGRPFQGSEEAEQTWEPGRELSESLERLWQGSFTLRVRKDVNEEGDHISLLLPHIP